LITIGAASSSIVPSAGNATVLVESLICATSWLSCTFFFAATAAGNIERNGDDITDFQHLNVVTLLDNLARDLMTKDQTLRSGRTAAHHVLVGTANIRRDNFQDDAMRGVFAAERVGLALRHAQLRVFDRLDLDFTRFDVSNSTIGSHVYSP